MLTEVYLGLGSNLGDKRGNIERAVESLYGISRSLRISSLYETAPVGVTLQPSFVNAVCGMWTGLNVFELLREIRGIQREAGVRGPVLNGPRMLDIDILLYGSLVIDLPHLTVPHPRMDGTGICDASAGGDCAGDCASGVRDDGGGVGWEIGWNLAKDPYALPLWIPAFAVMTGALLSSLVRC